MKRIGITGGIGSGKSIVCKVFELLGVPVFYADAEAKKLYFDDDVKETLINKYGKHIYLSDYELNKEKLAEIIFNNPDELKFINKLIHPKVAQVYMQWCEKYKHLPYTLKEAAILFESGAYKEMDKIIAVSAPKEIRIKRIIKRDNFSRSQIEERMKNQWTEEQRLAHADFIIYNDDEQLVLPQIIQLHLKLTNNEI
ncbi:MAG: dephospho-CoA kinase [Bacteroidia bacterium]